MKRSDHYFFPFLGFFGFLGFPFFLYSSIMLQRVREWLTLGLIILLPFHAFGVTVLTKLIAGPGQPPLSSIAFWKEGVLCIIVLLAFIEILRNGELRKIDWIDRLIGSLVILSVVVSILNPQFSILNFALGFKYDFLPLVAFLILRRVDWSEWFVSTARTSILWVAFIVSVYGIATLFLPDAFFYLLGYSDLHSLYIANGPLAAFQQIGGSALHRVQSTFSGPNQFGIWLLLPIALAIGKIQDARNKRQIRLKIQEADPSCFGFRSWIFPVSCILFLISLILTFCRAAWVAAFVIIAIRLYPFVQHALNRTRLLWSGFILVIALFAATALFPNTLLRLSSSRGHIERPIEAIQKMIAHPLGSGLGSAGPATNRFSDTCVMLRPEDDPSWAKAHADLCVFLGDKQVQPLDRSCNCPFLPENWYLQIGVELGWIGFIVYLGLVGVTLFRLYEWRMENREWRMESGIKFSILNSQFSIFLAFLGVSIAGLFLHAWEDPAIAYTTWILLAYALMYGKHDTGVGHGIGSENPGRRLGD